MKAATTGFFQKCQQYFSRGSTNNSNSSQNYEVESDNEDQESFTSKLSNFGRAYQKVSTEDSTTKYSDSYQNTGSREDFSYSNQRKQSEDWSWSEDQSWSDVKKNEDITKPKSKKSATATTKKQTTTSTNEDLLIDFGGASKIEAAKKAASGATEDSSWANWENDAWESLNK